MEIQPQNPEFRDIPKVFHQCTGILYINHLHAGSFFMLLLLCAYFFQSKLFKRSFRNTHKFNISWNVKCL